MTTWLIVARFEADVDLDDDRLLNAIASEIAGEGGTNEDSIIGNIAIASTVELDAAYDAATAVLTSGGQ